MVWISEIESAKSVADLKMSFPITGAKRVVSRGSSTETSKEKSLFKKKLQNKKNAFSREGKSHS